MTCVCPLSEIIKYINEEAVLVLVLMRVLRLYFFTLCNL